ncbi:MFS general substrate transporter [Cantharellus anzutake]|uniref:MFS general substrate transporter n=1 Tax=Cantharellus anzutake TaxID=1750568 RepID=UPI001903A545|nr:MFS general substrate transporter [Cantharellus anzutake]KAF8337451.1 MFS general substrate transporter [Cantharellus anzutake]
MTDSRPSVDPEVATIVALGTPKIYLPKSKTVSHSDEIHTPTHSEKDEFKVSLDESESPLFLPSFRKWAAVCAICTSTTCVTCGSSMAAATFPQIENRFSIGIETATLSISLYIAGLGIGPLFFGGLSEFLGRNIIYRTSFVTFTLLTFPVAFANNPAVHLIFRFFTGFAGSAFLSVAGGSMADLFHKDKVSTPVALYSASPFIGPVLGPAISGFINYNASWRWTYYTLLIWSTVQCVLIFATMSLILEEIMMTDSLSRIRKQTGDDRYFSPYDTQGRSMAETVKLSVYKPFLIMLYEPMVLLLNIWTSTLLGIVYLTFSVFPIIFGEVHHFRKDLVGLSYLGLGLGMIFATGSQPIWNRVNARTREKYGALGKEPPPETTLYPAMAAAILVPVGLYMFAFTVYGSVHWAVPILLIAPFGTGTVLAFVSTFTFLVSTYRADAASAMSSNSFLRSSFAAAFPLFARPMFRSMTNTGALAFIAGMTTLMAPLPFVFYKFGPRLRKRSRYAVS